MSMKKTVFKREMLNAQRKKLKMTVVDIVRELGVSVTTWNKWVNGDYEPKREKFKKLCEILRLNESDLIVPMVPEEAERVGIFDREGSKKKVLNNMLAYLLASSTLEEVLMEHGYVLGADDLVNVKSQIDDTKKVVWAYLNKYGEL